MAKAIGGHSALKSGMAMTIATIPVVPLVAPREAHTPQRQLFGIAVRCTLAYL